MTDKFFFRLPRTSFGTNDEEPDDDDNDLDEAVVDVDNWNKRLQANHSADDDRVAHAKDDDDDDDDHALSKTRYRGKQRTRAAEHNDDDDDDHDDDDIAVDSDSHNGDAKKWRPLSFSPIAMRSTPPTRRTGDATPSNGYTLPKQHTAATAPVVPTALPPDVSLAGHANFDQLLLSMGAGATGEPLAAATSAPSVVAAAAPLPLFQAPTFKNLKHVLRSDSYSSMRAHAADDFDDLPQLPVTPQVAAKASAAGHLIATPAKPDVADEGDQYFRSRSHPLGTLAGDAPDDERPIFGDDEPPEPHDDDEEDDGGTTTPPTTLPHMTPIAFTPQKTELTPRSLLRLERKFNIAERAPRSAEKAAPADALPSQQPAIPASAPRRNQDAPLDEIAVVARLGSLKSNEASLVRLADGGVAELALANTSSRAVLLDITVAGAFRTSSGAMALGPDQERLLTLTCSGRAHRGVLLLRDVGTGATRSVRLKFDPHTAAFAPAKPTTAAKPGTLPPLPVTPWLANRTPIVRTVKRKPRVDKPAQPQAEPQAEPQAKADADAVQASLLEQLEAQRRELETVRAELHQQKALSRANSLQTTRAVPMDDVPSPALWSLLQWDKLVLSFGAVHIDDARRDVVALTNTSSVSRQFRVHSQPPDAFETSTHGSFVLLAGETASIQVTFRPHVVQKYNAQLRVTVDGDPVPTLSLPLVGFGGRGHVEIENAPAPQEDRVVRVELMRGQRTYNLSVRNVGERRAFVRAVALPVGDSGAPLIVATPSVCLLAPGATAVMQLRVDGQAPQRLLVLSGDDGTRRRRNRYLALQDPSAAAHAERASHDMYADAAYDELDAVRGVPPAVEVDADSTTTAFERVYDNDLFEQSLRDAVLEFAYSDAAPASVVPPADLVVSVGPASLGFHSSVLWDYVLPAHAHWRLESEPQRAHRRVFGQAFASERGGVCGDAIGAASAFSGTESGFADGNGLSHLEFTFEPSAPGVYWLPLKLHWRANESEQWRLHATIALVGICESLFTVHSTSLFADDKSQVHVLVQADRCSVRENRIAVLAQKDFAELRIANQSGQTVAVRSTFVRPDGGELVRLAANSIAVIGLKCASHKSLSQPLPLELEIPAVKQHFTAELVVEWPPADALPDAHNNHAHHKPLAPSVHQRKLAPAPKQSAALAAAAPAAPDASAPPQQQQQPPQQPQQQQQAVEALELQVKE